MKNNYFTYRKFARLNWCEIIVIANCYSLIWLEVFKSIQ